MDSKTTKIFCLLPAILLFLTGYAPCEEEIIVDLEEFPHCKNEECDEFGFIIRLADSEDGCIRCHYNKEKFEKLVLEWNESKHSKKKVTCIKCHGGNSKAKDIGKAKAKETTDFRHVKESITTKQGEELMSLAFDYCGQCHGHIYKDWVAGIHGKRTGSWNGEKEYWVCTKCHPPHNPKFQKIVPKAPPHGPLEIQFKGPQ